ncbi:hypothetical protein IOD13_08390 [Brevibacterium casei]|nr:hypothetical protein [Brevibacterium casei]
MVVDLRGQSLCRVRGRRRVDRLIRNGDRGRDRRDLEVRGRGRTVDARTSTLEESRTGTASDSPETAPPCAASAEPSSGPPSSSTRSSSQSDHVPDCL